MVQVYCLVQVRDNLVWALPILGGSGGVLDMCLCFGCGGVGGVGGEWVGDFDKGRERWGGVMSV